MGTIRHATLTSELGGEKVGADEWDAAHDLDLEITDVTGLQAALDAKLASASYTAADVLTKLLTVDGAGSGLDADLLDGQSSAAFAPAGAYAPGGTDVAVADGGTGASSAGAARTNLDVYSTGEVDALLGGVGGGGSGGLAPIVKGTTAGTPGTGAFTPNAASAGSRAWSTVPAGWVGLVRFEDGSDWELTFSYWNGTTLSRASTQLYASSSGSALSLTSDATAALVQNVDEFVEGLSGQPWRGHFAQHQSTTVQNVGNPSLGGTGTTGSATVASTNYLTEQPRIQYTSNTSANSLAGWDQELIHAIYSTSSGRGGFVFDWQAGASQLPTGPRFFAAMTTAAITTSEPSALTASIAGFAKDSTDTNLQLLTNDNSGSGGKSDTGIALVANGWYRGVVWAPPGGGTVYGLLIRRDTGDIWFGSRTTELPANGAALGWNLRGGLNGTNTGTAFVLHIGYARAAPG